VVASTTGGTVSRTLVERVLQRSHGNQADWHLAGRGGAAVEQGSLARLLVAMLGLLAASTLVLSGFALASGIQRASDRGASGPPSRSRAVWLGILFGVFSAVPACLLARLFVSFAAEPLDAQLSMSLFTWLGGLVFVPAAGFVVGAVANALEPAS